MILGLDVSTSITGYTILDYEGKTIRCSAWDMRNKNKFTDHFAKAQYIKDEILSIKAQIPITKVFIEQPFMFFNSGGSSAKTMATLQRFNGIVSWICYEVFGTSPSYLTAAQARKMCDIKIPRGQKAKKIVMQWVIDNEEDFTVEYTPKGNPKPQYFDMADSLVLARAALIKIS
jgi:Holliday junction resolvasome RuvABC endonuclease subunit